MAWRRDVYPHTAHALQVREPRLVHQLVGWFDGFPSLLVTRDTKARLWMWRWEASPFVNAYAGSIYSGACAEATSSWLWVPLYGPWTAASPKTAGDHMADVADLLEPKKSAAARAAAAFS